MFGDFIHTAETADRVIVARHGEHEVTRHEQIRAGAESRAGDGSLDADAPPPTTPLAVWMYGPAAADRNGRIDVPSARARGEMCRPNRMGVIALKFAPPPTPAVALAPRTPVLTSAAIDGVTQWLNDNDAISPLACAPLPWTVAPTSREPMRPSPNANVERPARLTGRFTTAVGR